MTAYTGTSGDDTFPGTADNDTFLDNLGGNDTFYGQGGADVMTINRYDGMVPTSVTMDGGAGSDNISFNGYGPNGQPTRFVDTVTIRGGDDNDIIQIRGFGSFNIDGGTGGADYALIDFTGRTDAVAFDLSGGPAATSFAYVSGVQRGVLVNVEQVFIAGGSGADMLTAGGSYATLNGGLGNDTLSGGTATAAYLDGGPGDDTLRAGTGATFASYNSAPAGVHVDLRLNGAPQDTGSAGMDTLIGITGLYGGRYADVLNGDNGANSLVDSAGGDDALYGNGGADTLNVLRYSYANSPQAASRVTLDGGAGADTLSFTGQDASGGYTRALDGVTMSGGDDNDSLSLRGFGSFSIDGGAGSDYANIDFTGRSDAVVLDVSAGGTSTATVGGVAVGTVVGVERFSITGGSGADTLAGNAGATLHGGGGNDLLTAADQTSTPSTSVISYVYGDAGDDTLTGAGNAASISWLDGGAGNDTIQGRSGNNLAAYLDAPAGVHVDLRISGPQDTGSAGIDTLAYLIGLVGSAFADVLNGDDLANTVTDSSGGDDQLFGNGGADLVSAYRYSFSYGPQAASNILLDGGAGNDSIYFTGYDASYGYTRALDNVTVRAGADNDYITLRGFGTFDLDGGSGSDTATIDFTGRTASVVFDVSSGGTSTATVDGAAAGTVVNVERFYITGGAGADTLTGTTGTTLHGGGGNDLLTATDSAATSSFVTYSYVYGDAGDDTLTGAGNVFSLFYLDGGAGNDTIQGRSGQSIAAYFDAPGGVHVDMRLTGPQDTGAAGMDTLVNVTGLAGGAYADVLNGDDNANALSDTAGGDDALYGNGGADTLTVSRYSYSYGPQAASSVTLDGGAGNDQLYFRGYDAGYGYGRTLDNVTLHGGADNDSLYVAGFASFTLDGGSGDDSASIDFSGLTGGVTFDVSTGGTSSATVDGHVVGTVTGVERFTISGGSGADALTANGGDALSGGDGGDTLTLSGPSRAAAPPQYGTAYGGAGDDTLIGAADPSVRSYLDGGAGDDTIQGRSGVNVATYSDATGPVHVDMRIGGPQNTGSAGTDTLINLNGLYGGAYADTLHGDDAADILLGGAGDDTLYGEGGDDSLTGGSGTNTIDGGAGVDTALYNGNLSAFTITTASDGSVHVVTVPGSGASVVDDTLVNVEVLSFFDRVVDLKVDSALTVAVGTAVTILTSQSYTGKTQLFGELDLMSAGSIASSSQVALKGSTAVFDVSGAGAGGATVTVQELSGVAGSIIRLGAGVLSLNETTPATYAGAITDGGVAGGVGGALVVNGSAPLTLTGTDSYTGKTQIYGQLNLAGSAVLNTSKAVTLKSASAVFDISQATVKEAILNLAGVAGSHIYLGANALKINDSTAATFSGVIADGGAAGGTGGALIVKGTAPLVLAGANTFTGGVTLLSGVLELGTPTAAGVSHALTFQGTATLQLDAGALTSMSSTKSTYGTVIGGFAAGDHIDLASLANASGATATYNGTTLKVASGGSVVTMTLTGLAAGQGFTTADDGHGHVLVGLVGG